MCRVFLRESRFLSFFSQLQQVYIINNLIRCRFRLPISDGQFWLRELLSDSGRMTKLHSIQCLSWWWYLLSNTKEIRGGLNIRKNIKNCIQLPLILREFMPYLSGSISMHQPLVYDRKRHFLSLLLVLSYCIAMKPILVGPEKEQLGRFTLHSY